MEHREPVDARGLHAKQWKAAENLPIIPYPGVETNHVEFYLDYATNREILLEFGLAGKPGVSTRPVTFQLGLRPDGRGANELLDAALDAAGSAEPVAGT